MTDIAFARQELAGGKAMRVLWPFAISGARDEGVSAEDIAAARTTAANGDDLIREDDLNALAGSNSEALMQQAIRQFTTVGDKSNLTLDPEIDSYYLMDAITGKLPALLVATDHLQDIYATNDDPDHRAFAEEQFRISLDELTATLDKAGGQGTSHKISGETYSALKALQEASAALLRNHDVASLTRITQKADSLFHFGMDNLDVILQARVERIFRLLFLQLGAAGAVLLVALAVNALIGRGLSRRLSVLSGLMQKLIAGESVEHIPYQSDRFETGIIVQTLSVFKATLMETERMRTVQHQLEEDSINERRRAMLDLADEFERTLLTIVDDLGQSADGLGQVAADLSGDAEKTASRSGLVASSMEMTSTNVQSVAGATEEMAASVHEIADRAARAAGAAEGATQKAGDAMAVVDEMNTAAERIGSSVELIARITSQTNLLALNATIEAARAGEHGKGFAVVATEVKALAQQTAKATEEINLQVRGVQEATSHAAAAMREISNAVIEMKQIAQGISDSVSQQTAAVGEISQATTEVAVSTTRISEAVGEVNETAGHTGAKAREALNGAMHVAEQTRNLRTAAEGFLKGVRVA